jgi:type II secretory pathway predicted ATPase ExeA
MRYTRLSKSAIYNQIQSALLESREQAGKTILLIIDEAHLLQSGPLEEIRLLTNFKMDSYDPFILILAGQSDLRRVMDFAVMEPFSQRIAMRYHMSGLSPEETKSYVLHHLKLAGAQEPILNDQALSAVPEVSFGIPRKIGAVTEAALTRHQDLKTTRAYWGKAGVAEACHGTNINHGKLSLWINTHR